MTNNIYYVRDLCDYDISNSPIDIRVFDSVWATVKQVDEDGGVVVQHLNGYPQVHLKEFQDVLRIAGGLFGLEPDIPIEEVRFATE